MYRILACGFWLCSGLYPLAERESAEREKIEVPSFIAWYYSTDDIVNMLMQRMLDDPEAHHLRFHECIQALLHSSQLRNEPPDRSFRYRNVTADITHVGIEEYRLNHLRRGYAVYQTEQG